MVRPSFSTHQSQLIQSGHPTQAESKVPSQYTEIRIQGCQLTTTCYDLTWGNVYSEAMQRPQDAKNRMKQARGWIETRESMATDSQKK